MIIFWGEIFACKVFLVHFVHSKLHSVKNPNYLNVSAFEKGCNEDYYDTGLCHLTPSREHLLNVAQVFPRTARSSASTVRPSLKLKMSVHIDAYVVTAARQGDLKALVSHWATSPSPQR
jgi:hypothetical protein